MNATQRATVLCSLLLVALASAAEAWTPLFDGRTLNGWHRAAYVNGEAEYTVQDSCIVGTTRKGTPNSFLCADRTYANFVLEFEFLVPSGMNSGVQVRSVCDPQINKGRVHGYQIEIDPSARAWTAGIYDEGRRGWLYNLTHIEKERGKEAAEAARRAFKADAWNHIRAEAVGPHLQTWLNGVRVADLTDSMTPAGVIALQVHATDDPTPKQVRWRNLRIQELPATVASEEAWKALRTWRYAQSRVAWRAVETEVATVQGAAWEPLETKLLELLDDGTATPDARALVCGWLGRRGGPQVVARLAQHVGGKELSAAALQALCRLPHPEVSAALRATLGRGLPPGELAAVVTALGERRDEAALDDFARLATHADPNVARAAVTALGRLGTTAAEERLRALPAALLAVRTEALLSCAERARLDGDRNRAARLCRELLGMREPETATAAALTVLTDTLGAAALPDVLTALSSESPCRRAVAAQRLATMPGENVGRDTAAALGQWPAAVQVVVLGALVTRADPATAPAAADLLKSKEETVRVAAARLLQVVARPADVPALAELAAGTGPAADAALQALARAPAPAFEQALVAEAQGAAATARRLTVLRAMGQRGSTQTVPLALALLATPDADAQRTSWRVLRDLAGPEHLAALLKALAATPDGPGRREAEKAVAECLRREAVADTACATVLGALKTAAADARPNLVALLGQCRSGQACAALVALLQDPDAQCRYEAVKALAEWPSAEPYNALRAYAAATDQETHHVMALRGCLRLLDVGPELAEAERTRRLDDLAAVARRDQEKEQVRTARQSLRVSQVTARSGKTCVAVPRGFVKGGQLYIDRPYTFTEVPAVLTDAVLVSTAMDDKNSKGTGFLTFRIGVPATVIVGYDGRAKTVPDWLKDWKALEPVLRSTDAGCPLKLFAKAFPAGDVALAGNSPVAGVGAMYIVGVTKAAF